MQKNHARAIRGLSIASLVVSAVFIVCFIAGVIMMAFLGSFMDAELLSEYYSNYSSDYLYGHGGYDLYDDYYDYYGEAAVMQMAFAMFDMLVWILVLGIILSVVTLIASIIVLRHSNDPQTYGKVFGWSIAGAIAGFFGSGMVLTILFIIIAVFADADKKLYQSGRYCATVAPPMPVQVPPAQYGAGVPPYGTPQPGVSPYGVPQSSAPRPSSQAGEVSAPSPQAQPFGAQAGAAQPEPAAEAVSAAAVVASAASQPEPSTERASHDVPDPQLIEVPDAAGQASAVATAAEVAQAADIEPATQTAAATDAQDDGAGLAQESGAADEATMVPLAEETIISNDGAGSITIEDAVISVDLGTVEAADEAGVPAKDQ